MRRCLTALMIVAAAPVSAARWTPVLDASDRAVYLDTGALAREGNHVRAWVREVHTHEQRSEQAGVNYFSANALVAYDCTSRTTAPLFKVFFGADGMELRRVNLDAAEAPAVRLEEAPGDPQRIVARTVIDQHQFQIGISLGADRGQAGFDELGVVVGRNGDADQRPRHRLSQISMVCTATKGSSRRVGMYQRR